MSENSENRPHIVYAKGLADGLVTLKPTYAEAKAFWLLMHDYKRPYMIATVGRQIDPSAHIGDPAE
jgi:hypothetical protein